MLTVERAGPVGFLIEFVSGSHGRVYMMRCAKYMSIPRQERCLTSETCGVADDKLW